MKFQYTLLAFLLLFAGAVAAADKPPEASGSLKYRIEYGKIPGDVSLTTRIKPDYPKTLRAAGVQGDVLVRFTIEGDGAVHSVEGACLEHPELAKLAETAVSRWKFVGTYSAPGTFTSVKTAVWIKFRLLERAPVPAQ